MAANTPTTYYVDGTAATSPCHQDYAKIKEKCGREEPANPKQKKFRPSIRQLLGKKYKDKGYGTTLSKGGTDNGSWMADHCEFLWIKPGPESHQKFIEKLNEMKGDLAEAVDGKLKQLVNEAKERIKEKAIAEAKEKAVKAAAKAGGRWVIGAAGVAAGGVGGIVTEGIATVWNLCDMAATGYQVATSGYDAYKDLSKLGDVLDEYKDIGKELERLGQQAKDDPQKAVADFMGAAARINPCTRAKRCALVPYKDVEKLGGQGCCPGQTGHHVMPGEMMGWSENQDKYVVSPPPCPGYEHKEAPTICVEGGTNTHGTHGQVHDVLEKTMDLYTKRKQTDSISYASAREMAITSVQTTFPESGCDRKCLRAQLDSYYDKLCKGNVKAASGSNSGGKNTQAPRR
ncbi:HNH/endonuclease VII fold toxin-2 domain-containing protein [Chitinimonas sp.]|uniref:HNH/endonuclease VII fold toxin-2 domain-containing protein n=1 Tax=Chitinimonas sp. TaxID=1934313 RepID=UPI002F941063